MMSLLFMAMLACQRNDQKFRSLPAATTGINFSNNLLLTDSFNILDYMYFFNGGGIAAGDINNDGLLDLYFSGNLVSGRLFLNLGDMKFRDITESAGVTTNGWGSGVSIVDVNSDGLNDLYVCQTGYADPVRRKNLLFINQGNLTFQEQAEVYGLADTSYSTHAAFFDFDRDGDLDIYLLNHDHQFRGTNLPLPKKKHGESPTTDKLLENRPGPDHHPIFVDISHISGIQVEGYGLGISIADFNGDMWPDIYISNDFISNDLLYLNQKNGTFKNVIDSFINHQSYNGMGNDVADFNNDGLNDIYVADMLPYLNSRRKLMAMNTSEDLFDASLAAGYSPQYTRNTLQLNNGFSVDSSLLPFSEIAQFSGVHSTDWSWSPVFADVDNDGWKDLFLTNGYYRDITDLDFITYRKQRASFSTRKSQDSLYFQLMKNLPSVGLPNFMYVNQKDLTFCDSTDRWGLNIKSLSNGSVIGDLDNDGDLDIITNNLDEEAFVLQNSGDERMHYLAFDLRGPERNSASFGAKIFLYQNGGMQYLEKNIAHGFMSSINGPVHFGLGPDPRVDSIKVVWPDDRETIIISPRIDMLLRINYPVDGDKMNRVKDHSRTAFFKDITEAVGLDFMHQENAYQDFKQDRNLPFRLSRLGPAMAAGDINGDGMDDIFLGGAHGFYGTIFIQQNDGAFTYSRFPFHSDCEDVYALFFDADQDSDLDLYVVSGGIESTDSNFYQDRLYRNDGQGHFTYDSVALPAMYGSGSCVAAGDFDQDGDLDLLVGNRSIPGQYGQNADVVLLENNGLHFNNVTEELATEASEIGMVTDLVWADINQDQWLDFIVVGEWMPITCFYNDHGTFKKEELILDDSMSTSGWWQSIEVADLDHDGDLDLVAGNLGQNMDMRVDQLHPATLYIGDFDGNHRQEVIISYFQFSDQWNRRDFPSAERDAIIDMIPSWKKKFFDYRTYAYAEIADLFDAKPQIEKKAYCQLSASFINQGQTFAMEPLPHQAQFSVITDMLIDDFNGDDILDILSIGNNYETKVEMGNFDASLGLLMLGNRKANFQAIRSDESQFIANGNTRRIRKVSRPSGNIYLVSRNNDVLSVFQRTLNHN